jgi:hypothetical protein
MSRAAVGGILRGISRLVRFKAEGFEDFAATPAAFLNSLAPMLAFPLVGGVILLLGGATRVAVGNMLASLVALLAPATLSQALALLWRREGQWLRYAVAYNWCQAAMSLLAVLLVAAMLSASPPGQVLLAFMVLTLVAYWLALCWFLASRGLSLSWWRAALCVVIVNIGTGILIVGPRLAAGGL